MTARNDWFGVVIIKVQFMTISNLKLTRTFVLNEFFSKQEIEEEIKKRFPLIKSIIRIGELEEAICSIG